MRHDAENRLHDLIRDNKQFIKDFTEDGNIYQYLIADFDINSDSRLGHTMVIMPRAANSFYITFIER